MLPDVTKPMADRTMQLRTAVAVPRNDCCCVPSAAQVRELDFSEGLLQRPVDSKKAGHSQDFCQSVRNDCQPSMATCAVANVQQWPNRSGCPTAVMAQPFSFSAGASLPVAIANPHIVATPVDASTSQQKAVTHPMAP